MKSHLIPPFKGKRTLKVILRTLHLVGFAGVFATLVTGEHLVIYWTLTILSGLGLLLLESLSNLVWFVQVRALVMYVKFVLLILLFVYPTYSWHFMILMILLSGYISHAPSSVRYYSLFHRKMITSVLDIKG